MLLDEADRTTAVVLLHTVRGDSLRIVDVGSILTILANSSPSPRWARFLGARASVHTRYVRCDRRGRITLATPFIEHLGLTRERRPKVVVVGCGRSIAILTVDAWARLEREQDDTIRRCFERLPDPPPLAKD
ncbi:MAG: division/cell wall cluster transcriptional repressor MraZ [Planctomycetes bacterium]|nr:division/cell wall cluster transcriptional repressor MraZ [Planctomycetota bacterium]